MAMGNGDGTLEAILKNTTHTVHHSSLSVRSQLMWGMNCWNDNNWELIMVKFSAHSYNCTSNPSILTTAANLIWPMTKPTKVP